MMTRRRFFKVAGFGAAACAVVPMLTVTVTHEQIAWYGLAVQPHWKADPLWCAYEVPLADLPFDVARKILSASRSNTGLAGRKVDVPVVRLAGSGVKT